MSEEIELNTRAEAMRFIHKINVWQMQYPRFVQEQGIKLVKGIILPIIKERMADFGYPKKIIRETDVTDVVVDTDGFMEITITSDYLTASGFNIATAFEKGTRRHFIAPRWKKALSFIYHKVRVFSKGHWVRGITARNVIEKTIKEFTPEVQDALNELTDVSLIEKVQK